MNDTTVLIYGGSGTGKSSLIAALAEHFLADGLTVKAAIAEESAPLKRVKSEKFSMWNLGLREHPFDAVRFASQGFWPQILEDPKSKLVHTSADVWLFEGLSTMGDLCLGATVSGGLAARYAEERGTGLEEKNVRFTDGQMKIGGNPQSHYGTVQRWMLDSMAVSRKLPGIKVWTAHELRVNDEKTMQPIVGPQIVGEAKTKTDDIPRLFANVFHCGIKLEKKEVKGYGVVPIPVHRLYLSTHADELLKTMMYKAKSELPDGGPPYLVGSPMEIVKKLTDYLWSEK